MKQAPAGVSRLAWTALLLSCFCLPAYAQRMPIAVLSDAQISELLEGDATLESRLDADLDGDGELDTVFVAQDSRSRYAIAMLAFRDGAEDGHRKIGTLRLDRPPLVRANMRMDGPLLVVEDLTGAGDTATQAAYRFRFDRKAGGLRLVALDAARYSRERRHDAVRLNWDPVSGRHVLAYGTPSLAEGSEAGYRYGKPQRSTRRKPAMSMDATPSADQALWRAGVRLGQAQP